MAFKKNNDPSGKRIRWETGSSGAILTSCPFRYHSIVGLGVPLALQLRVTGSFRATVMFNGCSVIRGLSFKAKAGTIKNFMIMICSTWMWRLIDTCLTLSCMHIFYDWMNTLVISVINTFSKCFFRSHWRLFLQNVSFFQLSFAKWKVRLFCLICLGIFFAIHEFNAQLIPMHINMPSFFTKNALPSIALQMGFFFYVPSKK